MNKILSLIFLSTLGFTEIQCITVVAQTPDSVGMPTVLRTEAKDQDKKGEKRIGTLLRAAADSIEAGDKNARAAIKGEKQTQQKNSILQREAGWGDGIQDLGWFILLAIAGVILILLLYLIVRGKIQIPFVSGFLSKAGSS
ncbi:hypothetical protein [Leptospira gomenensis]|nr:hypothetical protein [Leptospira gomenensis]